MVFILIHNVVRAAKRVNSPVKILKTYPLMFIFVVFMNMQAATGQSKMAHGIKMYFLITSLFHATIVKTLLALKFAQVAQCINVKMALSLLTKVSVLVAVIAIWHALIVHHSLMQPKGI
ncbi:hypothetical protein PROVRETT_08152 [Providencia rettgeri DSM 1131]|nr:hypothetical protein PROVRETT_08152 [Providencia rettgeri DSM 1131]